MFKNDNILNMKTPSPFSVWMRDNLKDAYSGLITQDIDFIIENKTNKYFIVEEKNLARARTGPAQAIIYKMLDEILAVDDDFLGCHKATLEHNGVWLDQQGKVSVDDFLNNPNTFKKNKYGQKWFESVLYFTMNSLWDGKGEPPTRKTEKEHTFKRESLLEPELKKRNIQREYIDWIFVNYVTGNFVLLSESNCFDFKCSKRIINRLNEFKYSGKKVLNPKSKCSYKFLGIYQISYDTTLSTFRINDHVIDRKTAIKMFNLDDNSIELCK